MRLILTLILLSAAPAFAQLAEPQLQTCPRATEGSPTTPWVTCEGGIQFAPITDTARVATGDFLQGTWRTFGQLPGETMVAVCPAGALLDGARCRTADDSGWATKFVRKDSLKSGSTWTVTFRWPLVRQYQDGSPITLPTTYVLTWYGTDAAGVANTPSTDIETAGPPVMLTAPLQRICAEVRARVSGVLSDPSERACLAPESHKPGKVTGVTVEFGQ